MKIKNNSFKIVKPTKKERNNPFSKQYYSFLNDADNRHSKECLIFYLLKKKNSYSIQYDAYSNRLDLIKSKQLIGMVGEDVKTQFEYKNSIGTIQGEMTNWRTKGFLPVFKLKIIFNDFETKNKS